MDTQTTVAAFDFDGTISYRDSLLPFLIFIDGLPLTLLKFIPLLPTLLGFQLGFISREKTKEAIFTAFFRGKPIEQLRFQGELFAADQLEKEIRPEAIDHIRWHQQEGHLCILISASLDIYLQPWAEAVGFDHIICSQLEIDKEDRVTGHLAGPNCRGEEKVKRLKEIMGEEKNYYLYAYGDSDGDKELLEFADEPFLRSS